ncbi:hypothetical protein HNR42_000461 [Deinobacterium chartae]|uniref:YtkA-like domain-containing protein n=1 Tax=Deinobacterium chartae TaxID=521158 RepID=A0A841HUM2_9DEIO|nr:FixH family protein [Deinobacterium chartae]MBB6097047.1 hypothetical protein [Deinobacterium chartae]
MRLHTALLALSATLTLVACRPPQSSGELSLKLDTTPQVGRQTLTVEITRGGRPLEGAQVSLEGNMNHAGMLPVTARAEELGGGRYQARNFDFNMAGDWIISATAEKDGETLSGWAPLVIR